MCLKIKKSGKIELKYKELGMFLKFPVNSCLDDKFFINRFFLINICNIPFDLGSNSDTNPNGVPCENWESYQSIELANGQSDKPPG